MTQIRVDSQIARREPALMAAVSGLVGRRLFGAGGQRLVPVLDLLGAELLDGRCAARPRRRRARRPGRRSARRSSPRPPRCRPSPPCRPSARWRRPARSPRRSRAATAAVGRTRRSTSSRSNTLLCSRSCAAMCGDLAAGLAVGAAGPAQRRELALVDAHGAEFAGLVDADRALDQVRGRRDRRDCGVSPVFMASSLRGSDWRRAAPARTRAPPTGARSSRPSRCPTATTRSRRSAPSWRRTGTS